jgi:excisionase family DNA binding protein
MAQKSGEWMTAREVADLLGVSAETVRRYIRLGQLPANRLPSGHVRIRREDASRLLPRNEDGEQP